MMSIHFLAGGSLHYIKDQGGSSLTWTGDHVCHSLPFLLLNFLELIETIDKSMEAALIAAAHKELAYLEQFG